MLAVGLPDHGRRKLILQRLEGRPVEGLHRLFDLLREDQLALVPAHLRVLENGLFNSDAKTAVSAAQWCQAVGKSSDAWLVPILVRAMGHWLEHEEPYPVGGGVVPDSPREALVRTLYSVNRLDLRHLVELAEDTRSDVSSAAVDCLTVNATESVDQRRKLVDMICAKRFPVDLCERFLDVKIPFTAAELSKLGAIRNDSDAAFRAFVVRRLLTHPGMDPGEAASTASLMKDDENGKVRDAVYQFLNSTERGS